MNFIKSIRTLIIDLVIGHKKLHLFIKFKLQAQLIMHGLCGFGLLGHWAFQAKILLDRNGLHLKLYVFNYIYSSACNGVFIQ